MVAVSVPGASFEGALSQQMPHLIDPACCQVWADRERHFKCGPSQSLLHKHIRSIASQNHGCTKM